jgi:hypothetical protein
MRVNDYLIHPLAKLFPQLREDSFAYSAFKEGVRVFGAGKVTLHEGKVLGGWHDLRASRDLGIDPEIVAYDGDDPLGFVLQENFIRPNCNQLQLILFVDDNTTWAGHGGDRKSRGAVKRVLGSLERYAKPGANLGAVVPFSFSSVQKLHAARNRFLKDEDGKDIPNTKALLPEVIDSIRDGKTESLRTVVWLADQTHEDQRKYLANIKFKGRKIERRKRQPKPGKTLDIARAVADSGPKTMFEYQIRSGIADFLKALSNHAGKDPEALRVIEAFRAVVRQYGGQE